MAAALLSCTAPIMITRPKVFSKSCFTHPLYSPLSSSSRFFSGPASRKSSKIHATTLEDKEKVVVDDTFQAKSPLDSDVEKSDVDPSNTSSGPLSSWVIKIEQSFNIILTDSVIKIIDAWYHDRHYARFYVLETIARVPYFAFMSVLHMYESFGWWRRADYLKVHFAESWNELHHLLIMEELGGNAEWFDRFLSQHVAVFYYFMTVAMYILSPRMAYHFSECVEKHAYSTYDKFLNLRGEELKKMPAPAIAIKYYTDGDMYLFDEFQTSRIPNTRRPKIDNLYDVFVNIREDELEHCKTMNACQTPGILRSPHSYVNGLEDDSKYIVAQADSEGVADGVGKSLTTPQRK